MICPPTMEEIGQIISLFVSGNTVPGVRHEWERMPGLGVQGQDRAAREIVNKSLPYYSMASQAFYSAAFLLDRLTDFERGMGLSQHEDERQWHGHVAPAIARLRMALSVVHNPPADYGEANVTEQTPLASAPGSTSEDTSEP